MKIQFEKTVETINHRLTAKDDEIRILKLEVIELKNGKVQNGRVQSSENSSSGGCLSDSAPGLSDKMEHPISIPEFRGLRDK
jgi:hypothetical protein